MLDVDANTKADAAQPAFNAFPAGSAYGTLLHDIFEWQLKEGWPLLQDDLSVSAETQLRWQRWWQTQANSLQPNPEHKPLLVTHPPLRHGAIESIGAKSLETIGVRSTLFEPLATQCKKCLA
jgi:hypothetical protein